MFLIDSLAKVLSTAERLVDITDKSAQELENQNNKALSLVIKDRAVALFSVHNLNLDDIDSLLYIHSYLYKDIIQNTSSFKDSFYKSPLYKELQESSINDFDTIIFRYIKLIEAKPFDDFNPITINLYLNLCLKSKLKCLIDFSKVNRDELDENIEYALSSNNVNDLKDIFKESFVYTLNNTYYLKCLYY